MLNTFILWAVIVTGLYLFSKSISKALTSSKTGLTSDYLQGYLAGVTNLKMYYYIIGSMPSTNWLNANKFKALKDRKSLLQTVPEEIKRGAGVLN
jgi:hypothetical protein|tara:strand:+ start:654 stop:938 length:285 start_codon:yes stop_codon:yes gene_type:complete